MKNDVNIGFEEFCRAIAEIRTGCSYDPRRDMYFIDPKTITEWDIWSNYRIPSGISSTCGHCGTLTTFSKFNHSGADGTQAIVTTSAKCPNCRGVVSFFILGCSRVDQNQPVSCQGIWMLPEPAKKRQLVIDKNSIEFSIFDAYQEAIGCFNDKRWRAVVTECGRTLEGIGKRRFTEEERKVLKDLGEGKNNTNIPNNLFEPILELTKAIRFGRLSGAHFDLQRPADEEIATKVLDLTEYLLKYFYELPTSASSLKLLVEKFEAPVD